MKIESLLNVLKPKQVVIVLFPTDHSVASVISSTLQTLKIIVSTKVAESGWLLLDS